jgi:hypothetical protein
MNHLCLALIGAIVLSASSLAAHAQDASCLTARAWTFIDAPTDVVFDTIADTQAYPDWNPFIIGVEPAGVDITVVGERFDLLVVSPFDGSAVRAAEETTVVVRPTNGSEEGVLAYAFRGPGFRFLGEPEREQRFTPVGESFTLYRTTETFCGPAAPFSYLFAQLGFALQTPAVKEEAELRAGNRFALLH